MRAYCATGGREIDNYLHTAYICIGKPGAAAQHYIVLYCIVFAALREERSRNVRSFELQLFRFDLCVNLINALCNPLLTVQ